MLKTRIPPPVYAMLAAVVMLGLHLYLPGPTVLDVTATQWAWLVAVPGGLLAAWAAATFGRASTTLDPTNPSKATRLVTEGPFQLTRNPMYLGLVLILTAWAAWLGTLSAFLVLPLFMGVVTFQQILPEERALEALFGEDYARYRGQVNRWMGCAVIRRACCRAR
jgi:protein-S-isoprenylcysteine O-methyltransferase Ste14